jgi:hypothetical protein
MFLDPSVRSPQNTIPTDRLMTRSFEDEFAEEAYLAKVGIRGEVFTTEDGFTRRKPKVIQVKEIPQVVPDRVPKPDFVSFDKLLTAHVNMVKSFKELIS